MGDILFCCVSDITPFCLLISLPGFGIKVMLGCCLFKNAPWVSCISACLLSEAPTALCFRQPFQIDCILNSLGK